MPESPDARLIERLRAGDEHALACIYDAFCTRMYRTAVGLCGSRTDAEDAVHDTFVGLWKARGTIGRIDDLTAYLFASLRHAVWRQTLQRKRRDSIAATLEHRAEQIRTGQRSNPRYDLQELLESLPADQREIVVMKIYGGLTFAEAALALDISPNTAASRYRYALSKLRDMLAADEAQHE